LRFIVTPPECPYSPEELVTLRKFSRICDDITTCRFVRDLPKQEHTFTVENLPDGSSRATYPEYDRDDFLAFLTHFRKLVAQKESTNIFVVLKLIGRYATDEERLVLKKVRKTLDAEATNPPLQMAIGPPGEEVAYTPKQIENVIFNGQVFHSADELQDDLRKLLDFDPFTKMMFLRYATILVKHAGRVVKVLKYRGHI
jgi:hypothetical protein